MTTTPVLEVHDLAIASRRRSAIVLSLFLLSDIEPAAVYRMSSLHNAR